MKLDEEKINMQITRRDLDYLQGLLPKFSYSALSLVELVTAFQLILSLALLVAKAGGMKHLPNSLRNIKGYMHGMRNCLNELSATMVDSSRLPEESTSLKSPATAAEKSATQETKS